MKRVRRFTKLLFVFLIFCRLVLLESMRCSYVIIILCVLNLIIAFPEPLGKAICNIRRVVVFFVAVAEDNVYEC